MVAFFSGIERRVLLLGIVILTLQAAISIAFTIAGFMRPTGIGTEPLLMKDSPLLIQETGNWWRWEYSVLNYTLAVSCPYLRYFTVVYSDDSVIAYTREDSLYDGNDNLIATFGEPHSFYMPHMKTIRDNNGTIISHVKYHSIDKGFEFRDINGTMIANTTGEWTLYLYQEVDIRIYATFLVHRSMTCKSWAGWDTCNTYYRYGVLITGIIILIVFILIAYHCACQHRYRRINEGYRYLGTLGQ